jgi:DNA polymerase-4
VECVGTSPDPVQFARLMETGYQRRKRPVRLLGLGVRLGEEASLEQLSLFQEDLQQ